MCQRGQGLVQELLEKIDDHRLRGIAVWLPMLPDDDLDAARGRSTLLQDERILKGWDGTRRIGDAFMPVLGLTGTAWDVYLLYKQDTAWRGDEPPLPDFWMHQLPEIAGAPRDLRLDAATLERETRRLLAGS